MEYTYRGKVVQHRLDKKTQEIHSIVEIPHPTSEFISIDIFVPTKFELASFVYVTLSDRMPEGGYAEVKR